MTFRSTRSRKNVRASTPERIGADLNHYVSRDPDGPLSDVLRFRPIRRGYDRNGRVYIQ